VQQFRSGSRIQQVADELRGRCAQRGAVPAFLPDFLERHDTGRPVQLPLPDL
jgi:hypothetical protein